MMLDEVDKLGTDFRGDPSSALLEVLDPEQNHSFTDHYLAVAFDLSHVIFIVTANLLDTIPPALRDRLEILALPGYSEEEKVEIARRHLIPRELEAHGLTKGNLFFEKSSIVGIIRNYAREAGVRNLEREIANVCRKVAVEIASGKDDLAARVGSGDLKTYLGPPKRYVEVAERTSVPGVAVGLAWTTTGGQILFVESTRMRGRGNLTLTGHLGEVMQESARTAMSILRSRAEKVGVAPSTFAKEDVHIHIPEGATPKDGPSAGVAVVASLYSIFKEAPVRADTAMTGEITLRGKVLPVGGIKEKALAARRAGVRRVILPDWNRNDVEEIPEAHRKGLEFIFVKTIDEVLEHAFRVASGSTSKDTRRGAEARGKGAARPSSPKSGKARPSRSRASAPASAKTSSKGGAPPASGRKPAKKSARSRKAGTAARARASSSGKS
jgi:ATP-dependent Lon protease